MGDTAPQSNALKPLIEQPIAIYFLTVAGRERGSPGTPVAYTPLPRARVLLAYSEPSPS